MSTNSTKTFSWKPVILLSIGAGLLVAGIATSLHFWVQSVNAFPVKYPSSVVEVTTPVDLGYSIADQLLIAQVRASRDSFGEQSGSVASASVLSGLGSSFEAPAEPARLRIPAIGVDATVQSVGLSPKGDMGIPTNFTDVAWYNKGALPGMPGSAVIDGHLDGKNVPQAVFYNLKNLKVGDLVEVEDKEGKTFQFRVVRTKIYDYDDPTSEVFSSDSSKARLNLITCGGGWIKDQKTYDERVVVFTELI